MVIHLHMYMYMHVCMLKVNKNIAIYKLICISLGGKVHTHTYNVSIYAI